MQPTPDQIISAFDDALAFFWGARREYVNRHDEKYAKAWIEAGLTLTLASIVFGLQMGRMFHDEKEVPTSIGIVDSDIIAGIDRMEGKVVDDWEKDISRWRIRVRAFKEKGFWYDSWGERPPHNPMVPVSVMAEFGYAKT